MSVHGARDPDAGDDDVIVRKADSGWVVGGENVSDLTSAMVLADLFAADHESPALERAGENPPASPARPPVTDRPNVSATVPPSSVRKYGARTDEAERLAVTVTQLEHALASRVRVEQAIGALAERHRLPLREAFDLLRRTARSRGQRVNEMAQEVVASITNPLLQLPDELARKAPEARPRGRSLRRARHAAQRH